VSARRAAALGLPERFSEAVAPDVALQADGSIVRNESSGTNP
jgi:hypothetical protein